MPGQSSLSVADRLAVLQDWQTSGRSAKEVAAAAGIQLWTLYAWRRRLMPECVTRMRARTPASNDQTARSAAGASPRFADVVVASKSHHAGSAGIEIILDDVVIRVPSGSESADVAAAVHAVRPAGRLAC